MSVFFWILMGLTWIGGVISMISDNFQNSFDAVKEVLHPGEIIINAGIKGTDACNIQKCNETLSLLNRLDAKEWIRKMDVSSFTCILMIAFLRIL